MKKTKNYVSMLLTFLIIVSVLTTSFPVNASIIEGNGFTVTKISNPDNGQREIDGLIEGGDRENSYTWRLAERGDYIYIATTRNIASALVNMYATAFESAGLSKEKLWSMIDVLTNGDIPRNDSNEGANIISYNRKTGKFKVIYTADKGNYFRMAVTFGDNVYFGSYSAIPTNPQYILKLDANGKFTKVFETMGSVSLRANCVYDDHLFFAGADDREEAPEDTEKIPTKMAILQKSNEDDTVWNRVADYKDFGDIPYDSIMSSWAGAPIWELASHNGFIYATAPSTQGFVIYKGHPATEGETANEYGWHWEEVVGLNNGINNPGLSDIKGGEPGTMRSLIGSVYEFNGDLYAYNFDHSFGGEAQAFAGIMQMIGGKDVKASEFLSYMYDSLHNPQKLWKLNDETGKFEECRNFTKLTENTTNEYVWRAGEYDGQMYIATMDANVFYGYLTQLTNGNFSEMSMQEIIQKIGYIKNFIKGISNSNFSEYVSSGELKEQLNESIDMLKTLINMEVDRANVKQFLDNYKDAMRELSSVISKIHQTLSEKDLLELAEYILTEDITDKLLDETLTIDGILFKDVDVSKLIPEELTTEKNQELLNALIMISEAGKTYNQMDDDSKKIIRSMVTTVLKSYLNSSLDNVKEKIGAIYDKIDWEGFNMYMYISNSVKNNEGGFDMFRTEDGINFEVITRNGFGDKYNYGCSAFLPTEEGLYIGTCNPFYGGQLYLLKTGIEPDEIESDEYKDTSMYSSEKTAIYFKKSSSTTYVRGIKKITTFVNNPVGKTTYISNNPKIAKVNSKGVVTALQKGTVQITVINNGTKSTYTLKVKNPILNKTKKNLTVGKSFKLKVIKGLIGKAKFKSSNKSVVKVTKKGKVTAKKAGKAIVTVTANGVKLKCKIYVK